MRQDGTTERETEATAKADRVRLIIADPDPLTRRAVAQMLRDSDRFTVVAQAGDGIEALELTVHYRPDILLTELILPRLDGLELVERAKAAAPEVQVVALTVSDDPRLPLDAVRRGASGVLSKELTPGSLVEALLAVHAGEAAISPALTSQIIERLRNIPEAGRGMRPVRSTLTAREWEVLDLMSSGATTRDIADGLVLTEDTVYSHVKHVLRKLGVSSRAEAVEAAGRIVSFATAA